MMATFGGVGGRRQDARREEWKARHAGGSRDRVAVQSEPEPGSTAGLNGLKRLIVVNSEARVRDGRCP